MIIISSYYTVSSPLPLHMLYVTLCFNFVQTCVALMQSQCAPSGQGLH
jgi:hypothetical protein